MYSFTPRLRSVAVVLCACAITLFSVGQARAAGVVTDCRDDDDLSRALLGGGTVTFDCGGKITPSGDDALRLLVVEAGVFRESKIKETKIATSELANRHSYFWQVSACNASGCTAGDWQKFRLR